MEQWRLIPFDRFNAFENMAIDEAILQNSQRGAIPPTLRFYSWQRDTVSLGYFQDASREVDLDYCRAAHIDVVRRPTGGKAVLHEHDLTYSVVAREDDPPFSSDIMETYRVISQCLIGGLHGIGIEAYMMEEGRTHRKGTVDAFCFSVPSQYELLVEGRKICGSAQVRGKGSFLQHGSILIDADPSRIHSAITIDEEDSEDGLARLQSSITSVHDYLADGVSLARLCEGISKTFEELFDVQLVPGDITEGEEALKERLLQDKYTMDSWNLKGKRRNET